MLRFLLIVIDVTYLLIGMQIERILLLVIKQELRIKLFSFPIIRSWFYETTFFIGLRGCCALCQWFRGNGTHEEACLIDSCVQGGLCCSKT